MNLAIAFFVIVGILILIYTQIRSCAFYLQKIYSHLGSK